MHFNRVTVRTQGDGELRSDIVTYPSCNNCQMYSQCELGQYSQATISDPLKPENTAKRCPSYEPKG